LLVFLSQRKNQPQLHLFDKIQLENLIGNHQI
jgi:hypothetical protein